MDKGYESDLYYDVVIKGGNYKGWTAPDVGSGHMRFTHPEHEDFNVGYGLDRDWMEKCWYEFLIMADNLIK